jgi:hypothetical protein
LLYGIPRAAMSGATSYPRFVKCGCSLGDLGLGTSSVFEGVPFGHNPSKIAAVRLSAKLLIIRLAYRLTERSVKRYGRVQLDLHAGYGNVIQ